MDEYISTNSAVCHGRPHVQGTRITVELIRDYVVTGHTVKQIQDMYPHLSIAQIRAAIDYAISHGSDVTPN